MNDEITLWLQQLKQGDTRSQQEIWDSYFQRLVTLAHSKLRSDAKRQFDEEDVALSAFNSFFRAVGDQRLPKLDDRDDLWKVLVTFTVHKILDQRKRDRALKRGSGNVRGESVFLRGSNGDDLPGLANYLGAEPTPEVAAMVAENFEQLTEQLPDETFRQIAQLKMEGYTNKEIAKQVGSVERTVERKLERIRDLWS